MTSFQGFYFDGLVPDNVPAQLTFADREVTLTIKETERQFDESKLSVSPRIGTSERFILLPDGGQFLSPDHAFFDRLSQDSWSEGPVAWLEGRLWVALICIALVVGVLLAGHFYGLPAAADRVVTYIPIETEQALGRQVVEWLEEKGWVTPTQVDVETKDQILQGFENLIEGLPYRRDYELRFYESAPLGANALAFPGGIILITDDLVNLSESTEEVLAVLAHEIGHVEGRHMMKSVLQQSVVAVVITAITSDASTLSAAVTGLPMVLAQMKYSRKFEASADEFAFDLLTRHGYSPAAFASIMERLAEGIEVPAAIEYISSHPLTRERAQKAREAALE